MTDSSNQSSAVAAACRAAVERHLGREGALLPVLQDLQTALGFISDEAVAAVAEGLNLSRAEVHGVLTFYHDFRRVPAARHLVKLCQAEACQARGGRAVTQAAETLLGVALGGASADGAVALEPIYCLGLCASGPAALVGDRPVARLTPESVGRLAEGRV